MKIRVASPESVPIHLRSILFRGSSMDSDIRARGYKTFFVLNSAEHGILSAHKSKNIKKISIFQAQISLECYFSCS